MFRIVEDILGAIQEKIDEVRDWIDDLFSFDSDVLDDDDF